MDLYGIVLIVGVACLGIAAIVAGVRPFEQWKSVAVRMASMGAVLVIGGLIWRALSGGPFG
jgi:hypothetical protein